MEAQKHSQFNNSVIDYCFFPHKRTLAEFSLSRRAHKPDNSFWPAIKLLMELMSICEMLAYVVKESSFATLAGWGIKYSRERIVI